ncbi:MAG: hypothetical protein HOQ11_17285 [Gemmatimonadaceae bacterium]|nr:hypothetical protein [Gemmatimonadaceae bacterium]NUQ93021.1 hypothetical protein [Gemmatimonadaceae bacterium]NUR19411.1 hypothetical protein [Gemmatimonadaceae bacterium]NUS99160.1 hypothetical protein [Gemmatimonadaceae bacterium]
MLTLQALANWEAAVLASLKGATGTVEERDAQITRSGLYAEYPAIFATYNDIARDADDPATALEALKRAVFIAWYGFTEPPVQSGIAELPESAIRATLEALDRAIRSGRADDELQWMLAWYHASFGYVFEHFGPVRSLDEFIAHVPANEALAHREERSRFAGRGQLGVYWSAVLR